VRKPRASIQIGPVVYPGRPPRPGIVPGHRDKYALVERERRFLLAGPPGGALPAAGQALITDRYLTGTRLRLRQVTRPGSPEPEYKLTQKVPAARPGPVRGLITNIYLSRAEHDLLATLPAAGLAKTRLFFPPYAVDVFGPPWHGLVLAEVEMGTDADLAACPPPPGSVAEVTCDDRFTGGRLAVTPRAELLSWLAEYGVRVAGQPG
jgi:CYTH domain-containing protein